MATNRSVVQARRMHQSLSATTTAIAPPGRHIAGAVNAVFAALAALTMVVASALLPHDPNAVARTELMWRGLAFQGSIAAAAMVIVAVNHFVFGNDMSLLWRRSVRRRTSQGTIGIAAFGVFAIVVLAVYIALRPSGDTTALSVTPWIVFAPLFAIANAVSEEIATRFTVYHFGSRVGTRMKIAISSVLFGAIHLASGTPSGVVGFVLSATLGAVLMGLTLAHRSMRSAILIHFCLDLLIFVTLISHATG